MKHTPQWFEVNKEGLAKLRADMPKSALATELVQNAWDTNATECSISLSCLQGTRHELSVIDNDPDGFTDLAHSYTLFAESAKKGDSLKRGRFNLGEKLVLAMCTTAKIQSTKGTIYFDGKGRRATKETLPVGSRFLGQIRMTKAEAEELRAMMFRLIPPASCVTVYNGITIPTLTPLKRFEVILPTVIGDEDGNLRGSRRKCWVEVYEPQYGAGMVLEPAMVYEMGIPVVETGDRYHYNVLQKVPLTMDRSNVTPAFLRDIREAVAEAMVHSLTPDDAQATWVREAASSPDASRPLVSKVFESRFGKDAVIFDPSDPEANQRAMLDGKTVVHGGHMSKEEWTNVKSFGLASPAGQVYTGHKIETDPDGREWQKPKQITEGMRRYEAFTLAFAKRVLGISIHVEFVSEITIHMAACYGDRVLRFNVAKLGYNAFDGKLSERMLDLIIHELAHEKASNHLSDEFHEACTLIGARAVALALAEPALFDLASREPVGC